MQMLEAEGWVRICHDASNGAHGAGRRLPHFLVSIQPEMMALMRLMNGTTGPAYVLVCIYSLGGSSQLSFVAISQAADGDGESCC